MEKASMYIFGMSCAGCVASVKMALEDVPGVKHAAVDLEQCMAVVEYERPGYSGAVGNGSKRSWFHC